MGLRLHPADLIAQIVLVLHPRTFYEVTPRAVVYFVSSEYVRIELADDINYAVDQIQLIFLVFNLYWGLLSNSLSDAVFVREAQNAGTWAVGSRIFLTLHAPEISSSAGSGTREPLEFTCTSKLMMLMY